MTIQEMITKVINDYVSSNGTSSIMDKDQLYAMVSEVYQINKNSFLPADFCYNRTNEGIDFEKHNDSKEWYVSKKTSERIYAFPYDTDRLISKIKKLIMQLKSING